MTDGDTPAKADNLVQAVGKEPTVLLVEDDDNVRELLAAVLRASGYDVIELGDGIEALNYLAASSVYHDALPRPDLIISDIQMPTFTGLDLLAGMRESRPRPPIILFTGHNDPELHAEAYRLGADRVLRKPLSPEVLVQVVREVLVARAHEFSASQDSEEPALMIAFEAANLPPAGNPNT
ncbi:MAG: response regulator [Bradymonadaceae bacterium]|nr:response regulator [Lujinxingiaceae bacterium]